jgi:hypothetical protein
MYQRPLLQPLRPRESVAGRGTSFGCADARLDDALCSGGGGGVHTTSTSGSGQGLTSAGRTSAERTSAVLIGAGFTSADRTSAGLGAGLKTAGAGLTLAPATDGATPTVAARTAKLMVRRFIVDSFLVCRFAGVMSQRA